MQTRPNIIWLTLDSVRYDHTSLGEYDRNTTTNIQELSERSDAVSFSMCFSHARSSHASVPSILSGTFPSRHRTYFDNQNQFPEELPLISELLGSVGYQTHGLSNNAYASSLTNLDRGFDNFTLLGSTPKKMFQTAGIINSIKYLLNIRRHSCGFNTDLHAHSAGFILNELAKSTIQQARQPFFLYVHYNEPHRAYYPPLPYIDRFTSDIKMKPSKAASLSLEVHHKLLDIVANGCNLSINEMEALIAMYDAEIAYTDELVGKLVDVIETQLGETVIVVTADHGELFGEDNMLAHKYSMHNAVLNVPMVVAGISDLSDTGVIQHSDIVRTILEIAGADTGTIQGVDLRTETRKYAISQSGESDVAPLLERNPNFDLSRFCSEEYSVIQNEDYKYVRNTKNPQLYYLPDEDMNVIDESGKQAEKMDIWLTEWLDTEGQAVESGSEAHIDSTTRSRLANLGYLNHEM